MSRTLAALSGGGRELRRTPLLVALLVVAPAYVVGLFAAAAPAGTAAVHVDGGVVETSLSAAFPAFTTPMTAALLSGVFGLFVMQDAAAADGRLVVAGYRPREVVLARLALLAGVAVLATAVSVGVMLTAFSPANLGWYVVGTALAAAVYGAVGVLLGVVLGRVAGVYVVLFGTMIDLFVFQNPLSADPPAAARLLPGHHPLSVATEAAFAGHVDLAAVGWSLLYLTALGAVATAAFHRRLAGGA